MDSYPVSCNSLERIFHINGDLLGQQYKDHLSDYKSWDQKDHAHQWVLFPSNIGPRLSIDETSLSNGELYTILTNKDGSNWKVGGIEILRINFTESEYEEIYISDPSLCCSESLDFCIKRFCRSISTSIIKEV